MQHLARWTNRWMVVALSAAIAVLMPGRMEAQFGDCGGGPCVTITPVSGVYDRNINPPADTVIAVEVTFCHDSAINWSTRSITLNGVSVSSSLSHTTSGYGMCAYGGRSWGNITLSRSNEGLNEFNVYIEDNNSYSGWAVEYYDYRWEGYVRPTYQISVDPIDVTVERFAGTGSHTVDFKIRNEGSRPDSVDITATCLAGASSCSLTTAARIWLDTTAVGRVKTATLSFTAGSAGDTNQVRLRAVLKTQTSVKDSAVTDVMVVATEANGTPGLVLARRTDVLVPGLCVSFPTGPASGSVCGDLVVQHAFPGVTTRNQYRAPALQYNSNHALPTPVIQADLTLPNNGLTPSSVEARLYFGTTEVAMSSWTSSFAPGKTRRISLSFNASGYATGRYAYTLEVRRIHGGTTYTDSLTGTLLIVNRSGSPFGAGWWVAGVERLLSVTADTLLRVGGDGSALLYGRVSTGNTFVAPAMSEPDTISYDGSTWYSRRLSTGARLRYDNDGYHKQTISRLGDTTYFAYDGSNRVAKIRVPRWATDSTFSFVYDGSGLTAVRSPGPGGSTRVTNITVSSGDLTKIVEAAGDSVMFTYGSSATARRIIARRNRLGVTTHYRYDAGLRVAADSLPMPSAAPIVRTYKVAETRGLPSVESTAYPVDSAYTQHDGARTDVNDVTRFWVNALGAPVRIRNAHGRETTASYDTQWPALVSESRSPTGAISRARYNARGLPDTTRILNLRSIGDPEVLSRYAWNADYALPDSIWQGNGSVVKVNNYLSNGNLNWTQVGLSDSTRVYFNYWATGSAANSGLYRSSTLPTTASLDTVEYDASLGNTSRVRDRSGVWRSTVRDGIGRAVLDSSRVDENNGGGQRWRVDSTQFDAADRVNWTRSIGPPVSYSVATQPGLGTLTASAETLFVSTAYDAEGAVTSVERWARPDSTVHSSVITYYEYDHAGRKVSELNEGTGEVEYTYDPAGLLTRTVEGVLDVSHRGTDISMEYDALGQLVRRTTIATVYPVRECDEFEPYGADGSCYFVFPLTNAQLNHAPTTMPLGTPLRIDGDTATFDYDHGGRITRADNAHARIRRTWSPGGLLLRDTAQVRTLRYKTEGSTNPANDFSGHTYVLTLAYDVLGRRTDLTHPDALDACSGACGAQKYYYRAYTGQLDSLTDIRGKTFKFHYNRSGQPSRVVYPGGVEELHTYDAEGRDSVRVVGIPASTTWLLDSLNRDSQGRIRRSTGRVAKDGTNLTIDNVYAGLGAIVLSETNFASGATDRVELFENDALGNMFHSRRYGVNLGHTDNPALRWYEYDAAGRQTLIATRADSISLWDFRETWYGAKGRTVYTGALKSNSGSPRRIQEGHYYDGLGRLATFERHVGDLQQHSPSNEVSAVIENYRYDALGRRVLVHTNRLSSCTVAGCDRVVRRNVWDGDNLLYEIRARASDTTSSANVESDAPTGSGLGSVANALGRAGYTHAGGIDRPLGVIRLSGSNTLVVAFYPHTNWRGVYEFGTNDSAARITNAISWPGELASAYLGATPNSTPDEWMGSLILEQADASGLLYRRNRYYDPASGRFTQMDPIGLAGGLNLYGFAGGDPVNFSDPFGLCPDPEDGWCRLFEAGMAGLGATVGLIAGGGVGLGATVLSGGALAAPAVAATAATTALGAAYGLAAGRALSNVLFSKSGREQEPGQQYEEISEAQQRVRRQGQPDKINSIKKSKQRDRVQIRDEAEEALGALRERP